jgi:hypothetical protein
MVQKKVKQLDLINTVVKLRCRLKGKSAEWSSDCYVLKKGSALRSSQCSGYKS